MKKYLTSKTVKMAVSATIAIFISNEIGLHFSVTSGIIAILSIANTKKEAIKVGIKRLIASTISILISYGLYVCLGNSPLIFGLFLLIFIPITAKFNLLDGMVVGAVLSTHLLTSSNIDLYWIGNEIVLTLIGIFIALLFNLYTPSLEEKFEDNRYLIEEKFRVIISEMARSLVTHSVSIHEKRNFDEVEAVIAETKEIAYIISGNYLLKKEEWYINYINMRIMQLDTIKRMNKHFFRFYMKYEQTVILSNFTKSVAENINLENDCLELLNTLENIKNDYKRMDLPKTRDEFENRALLFQFLNDLEDFILLKREYISKKLNNIKILD